MPSCGWEKFWSVRELLLTFGVLLLEASPPSFCVPLILPVLHPLSNMQIARQEMIHTFVSSENSILCLIDWWHQQTANDNVLSTRQIHQLGVTKVRWRKRCKIILLTSLWVSSAVSCDEMENMEETLNSKLSNFPSWCFALWLSISSPFRYRTRFISLLDFFFSISSFARICPPPRRLDCSAVQIRKLEFERIPHLLRHTQHFSRKKAKRKLRERN